MNDIASPANAPLAKSFEPAAIEARWSQQWEARGYFAAGLDPDKPAFTIQLPPPNVTGILHMGHAFNQTIMDALTRYHRMLGYNTLWLPGTDHAGIATQIVVERQLEANGIDRRTMGREAFTKQVWDWVEYSGGTITRQMRRLGASVDWSREYFTLDESLSTAVTEVFVRLYEQGLMYRGKRLANWDPVLKTAVSDLEVVNEEEEGKLYHLRYPLADGSGQLVVATTRPETMLGDTAVMVHPDDGRYAHLVGRRVRLPLAEREIPIIADEFVDREFGTGVVKVTPAHDFNDYAVGQRHGLPMVNIFTLDATINDAAPAKYRGLDRFKAREAVVADLQAAGLVERIEKHLLKVPRGDRTGVALEPLLTDQWFMAMSKPAPAGTLHPGKSIAQAALEVVERGEIRIIPEQWRTVYCQWLQNIQDWCVSRQLWWGHQIPAWYDADGNVYVARSESDALAQAGGKSLTRDPDVLDTWFSSALVPFSTLGWPDEAAMKAAGFDRFLPSTVLTTALRDPVLLGRAHGDDDAALHRPGAVPRRVRARPGARRRRQEDEQVRRQRARPGRPDPGRAARGAAEEGDHRTAPAPGRTEDRKTRAYTVSRRHAGLRSRRAALHDGVLCHAGSQHQLRHQALRGLSQLLQQAVERDALRADERRRARLRT